MNRRGADAPLVGLDDELEATLGIDRLARMELMLRIESAFRVRMSETLVQQAVTPRDLLDALDVSQPRETSVPCAMPAKPLAAGAVEIPSKAQTLLDVPDRAMCS
ncbi:MAG TPA: acyl carrier protein [Burkholderiaceae bacterium]|nr:acyl carrier protein [Burkholderiaceae bacterium]